MGRVDAGISAVEIPQKSNRRTILLGSIALALLTFAAYGRSLTNGYIWDDDDYVTENLVLRSPTGIFEVWRPKTTPQYYPLVFVTFWCEYRLWGLHPAGYHTVNVALHLVSALLFWLALRRLAVPGAWLAAALFALHPVQVESVAWITERKNVLSLLFYLAALHAWLSVRDDATRRTRWGAYAATLVLFACALLSKTVTCSLPAALLVIEWWRHGRIALRTALLTLPLFALGLALAAVTVIIERDHVGAGALDFGLTALDRVVLAGRIFWFYLGKLIWPWDLIFIYPRWEVSARDAAQWLYPAAAIALLAGLWLLRSRIGRGPLAAALLFGGTLVPALGFIDVYPMRYSWVADHFQYHATLAPLAVVAAVLAVSLRQVPANFYLVAAVLLAAVSARTMMQTLVYKDARTLWGSVVLGNPDAWMAHHNLATYLIEEGDIKGARAHIERSLERFPRQGEGYSTLAQIALRSGEPEKAIELCEKAIEIGGGRSEVWTNLASAQLALNRPKKALQAAEQAVKLKPNNPGALSNLGYALLLLGRGPEAIRALERSVTIDPKSVDTRMLLGNALMTVGRHRDALPHIEAVLKVSPDDIDARVNRVLCLVELGRMADAQAELAEAERRFPNESALKVAREAVRKGAGS
jgi:tetratricopeptide (TPR) repeat protein